MITPDMIGRDGRVPVWIFSRREWHRAWPVDAKEIVTLGAGSLTGPEGETPPEPKAGPLKQELKPHPIAEPDPKKESARVKEGFPESVKAAKAAEKPQKKSGKK